MRSRKLFGTIAALGLTGAASSYLRFRGEMKAASARLDAGSIR